jgi:hypothetical protein
LARDVRGRGVRVEGVHHTARGQEVRGGENAELVSQCGGVRV